MNNIFELKDIIWFFMGWLVPELSKKIYAFIKNKKINDEIEKYNSGYLDSDDNICPLSHGAPFFDQNTLSLSAPSEKFYLSIPTDVYNSIVKKDPDFDHTSWDKNVSCCYWDNENEEELLSQIIKVAKKNVDNDYIKNLIMIKRNEVAQRFDNRVSEAFFNGEKYGIKNIMDCRVGNEEKAKLTISCFRTDYYTHRVMAAVYEELLKENKILQPKRIDELNKYYPFLTSIGVNILLVIENKSKIVLAKRSKRLINMSEDQWHMSANEGVSITDLSIGSISLENCARRGLQEELGIICDDCSSHFCDVFMVEKPLEVGILTIMTMDNMTESKVRESYNVAQDAPLESTGNDKTGLMFLNYEKNAIYGFCNNNHVTESAKYALKMAAIRKDQLP